MHYRFTRLLPAAVLLLMGSFIFFSLILVFTFRWVDPPTGTVILVRKYQHLQEPDKYPEPHYRWIDWSSISPYLALAIMAAEDQRFPYHAGFDFQEIEKALQKHKRGHRLRGASTITQQVAKNLFLWQGRSFIRKALEAYFTVLLELLWPKKRILEVYLNIAEFGPNIFGVGYACPHFFTRPPSRLTPFQAARMAAVLPNPWRFRIKRPSAYVQKRTREILQEVYRLRKIGYLRWLKTFSKRELPRLF